MGAAAHYLTVVDDDGHVLMPMRTGLTCATARSAATPRTWTWCSTPGRANGGPTSHGLARPPETFLPDRAQRDAQRRRSQWEVRVKKYRNDPEPPEAY